MRGDWARTEGNAQRRIAAVEHSKKPRTSHVVAGCKVAFTRMEHSNGAGARFVSYTFKRNDKHTDPSGETLGPLTRLDASTLTKLVLKMGIVATYETLLAESSRAALEGVFSLTRLYQLTRGDIKRYARAHQLVNDFDPRSGTEDMQALPQAHGGIWS